MFFGGLLAGWVGALARQAVTWRRSSGERRQQLKWLMSGAAVCGIFLVASFTSSNSLWEVLMLGVAALPVSIGIGILKYRLYDIDRIISRTLAYALVTGLLVGLYAGLVLLATQVLRFASPVAVAASTLAAAALFAPVRRRVQRVVDRRFNRARYDADAAVDAFAARLQAPWLPEVRADLARWSARRWNQRTSRSGSPVVSDDGAAAGRLPRGLAQDRADPRRRCWSCPPALVPLAHLSPRLRRTPGGGALARSSGRLPGGPPQPAQPAGLAAPGDSAVPDPLHRWLGLRAARYRLGYQELPLGVAVLVLNQLWARGLDCSAWLSCCSRTAGCPPRGGGGRSGSMSGSMPSAWSSGVATAQAVIGHPFHVDVNGGLMITDDASDGLRGGREPLQLIFLLFIVAFIGRQALS